MPPLLCKKKKGLYRDFCLYTQTSSISNGTQKKFMWLPLKRKMDLKRRKTYFSLDILRSSELFLG